MAYDYARRKALAAAKLAAAGIDARGRNPEKVYRALADDARQRAITALARERPGYHSGGVYRPGRSVEHVRERVRGLARGGKRTPLVQHVPQAGATVTTSRSHRSQRHALRQAVAAGDAVTIYVTATKDGITRTRVIDGRGEQGVQLGSAGASTDGRASTSGESGAQVLGKVQIVAAPRGGEALGRAGMDPGELLDYLDAYDDWDDAWADLWDSIYE